MKIGILTFHYAHNYGAVLQAFALKQYLTQKGHDIYIIPYTNNCINKMYPYHLKPMISKKDLIYPSNWHKILKELKKVYYSKKDWKVQYIKFDDFIKLHLTQEKEEQWRDMALSMDEIFFGSDQIWEKNIIGSKESVYFGKIPTTAKKISYAASCFSEDTFFSDEMVKYINQFSMISVREEGLAKKLRNLIDKEIKVVCDPVFFLEKQDYNKIIKKENQYGDYILFYFVSEDKELQEICEKIRKTENIRVIEIHYFKKKKVSKDYISNVGPLEFLSLISYAKAVYTNSFHGTAFSIIYEKEFVTKSKNMRLINILKIMNLQDRLVDSFDEWMKNKSAKRNIDYEVVNMKKELYVLHSKDYIDKALKLVEGEKK